ncbi:MAG: threonine synthase [Bryobacteraceae bacterium]
MLHAPGMFTRESLRQRPPTLWRYREALGVNSPENTVTLGEGFTPLIDCALNGRLMLKLDFLCPTGSYKDRGSTVMISKLKEWGVAELIEDSSGNAGASIAAYASLAGIRANIYVPASTSAGKVAQIEMYGADLIKVPGSREDTTAAAFSAALDTFYASHNWSPYFLAGMKTAAYEIAEQLAWKAPDWIVTPVGGGGLLVGLYLGFTDLLAAGLIERAPRLAAVQANACDPVYRAWRARLEHIPAIDKGRTAAEGISVAKPVRGKAILEAIRESDGVVITVDDDEVWTALETLGRQGIYVEPTAAAAPAALRKLHQAGVIGPNEQAVVMLTGSGLKATDKIVGRVILSPANRPKAFGRCDLY